MRARHSGRLSWAPANQPFKIHLNRSEISTIEAVRPFVWGVFQGCRALCSLRISRFEGFGVGVEGLMAHDFWPLAINRYLYSGRLEA